MGGTSPDDESSGKCFSGILSRILCSRSLPTHPSDQLPEPEPEPDGKAFFGHRRQESSDQANNAARTTPGVVARLMGLESMPELVVSKGRPFGSFLRSRSVNFIDFLPQIGLTSVGEAQHRRVRTSMSFREAIGFDKEKHDFLVVCFDSRDDNEARKEVMPPQKHQAAASFPEVKLKKQMEKTNQKIVAKKKKKSTERIMEPSKRSLEVVSVPARRRRSPNNVDVNRKDNLALKKEKRAVMKKPVDSKRVPIESNPAARKKKKSRYVGNNRIQPEYASILDHPKTSPANSAENSGKLQKSSKKELLKARQPHMRTADKAFINDQAPKAVEDNVCRARKKEADVSGCGSDENTLLEICRLAEEYASEYWWVGGGVLELEDSEEICMHFGQQILDVLLNDVVGELVLMHQIKNLTL